MRIAPYWTRVAVDAAGNEVTESPFVAYGWSAESEEAAHALGLERARRVAAWFRDGPVYERLQERQEYYLERPVCEPIVEWIGETDDPIGVITRNAYGAYILNTARVMFIDVDVPYTPPPRVGLLARLFGWAPPKVEDPSRAVEARILEALQTQEGIGFRLYRTHSGFRGIVTDRLFEPNSDASRRMLDAFGADPLYRKLCVVQDCFRARLSPKPWRVGLTAPPTLYFPWANHPEREARFAAWDATYAPRRAAASVCDLVLDLAPETIPAEVARVVDLHDAWCLGDGPLA